ncbi:MAG: Lrp/AsnC ligand binding domain-containing protein, partial [Bacteroidales bacterium]|nr:Lrp/AsnC ligand binding domain-containing protein [Bacteroidales bacterium]
ANKYPQVVNSLKHIPEIVECHFVTGRAALFVKVFCFDNDHLMEVLLNTIQKIPYIQSTDTMISLDEAFERQVWVKDYSSVSFTANSVSIE